MQLQNIFLKKISLEKVDLVQFTREIAVKRLSRSSGQGLQEFKNEVILIARLQHRSRIGIDGPITGAIKCCRRSVEVHPHWIVVRPGRSSR
ncbi:unnamed protein product [Camellia sinensis]